MCTDRVRVDWKRGAKRSLKKLPVWPKRRFSLPVPAVKMRAALSPTMRPMARMMPERMPGMAAGRMTLNTVRSLPAPRPKEPSR